MGGNVGGGKRFFYGSDVDWWAGSPMTTDPESREGQPPPLCSHAPAEGRVPPLSSWDVEERKGLPRDPR